MAQIVAIELLNVVLIFGPTAVTRFGSMQPESKLWKTCKKIQSAPAEPTNVKFRKFLHFPMRHPYRSLLSP